MNKKYIGNPLGFYNDLQDKRIEEFQKGGGFKQRFSAWNTQRKINKARRKACRGGNKPNCTRNAGGGSRNFKLGKGHK
jgi:hypothetical protein